MSIDYIYKIQTRQGQLVTGRRSIDCQLVKQAELMYDKLHQAQQERNWLAVSADAAR
jgi:hypothetical protein